MSLVVEGPSSVTWKGVRIPGRDERYTESPAFRMGNEEWKLFCCCKESICLSVKRRMRAPSDRRPPGSSDAVSLFSFSVRVGGGGGETPGPGELYQEVKNVSLRPTEDSIIWIRRSREVESLIPEFLSDRRLTFHVAFGSKRDADCPRTGEASAPTSLSSVPCYEALSEDFSSLLDDADSTRDVVFRCGDQSLEAHRLVLRVRSPVLARMLQSEMIEGKSGEIKIDDMDPDTLRLFVRYLYTGRVDIGALSFDAAMALYEAADKYQVKCLGRRCAQRLIDSLSLENCCEVLLVADAHQDSELVEAVVGFMLAERVPLSGDRWRAFRESHPKWALEIYGRFSEMQDNELRLLRGKKRSFDDSN